MKPEKIQIFQTTVWHYYQEHGRHELPWRQTHQGLFDPYRILVSEIMLQQTQVSRVTPKYAAFLETFPDIVSLANARLDTVLRAWSGLGYNRRAKHLWQAAQLVVAEHKGELPRELNVLCQLPGIGQQTAGAIVAYAWNMPTVFIETNIRTVFIHHFFSGNQSVTDKQIRQLVELTLPAGSRTRQWYWALMDYGSYLKTSVGNLSQASAHYVRQSRFEGSVRQIRGQVLRKLASGSSTDQQLMAHVADDRLSGVVDSLLKEGLIRRSAGWLYLGT